MIGNQCTKEQNRQNLCVSFFHEKKGKNPIVNDKSSCIKSSFHHKICYWLTIYHWNTHSQNTYTWLHLNSIASYRAVPRVESFFLYKRIGEKIGRKMFDLLPVMCVCVSFAHSLFISLWLSFARSFHKIITNLDKLIAFCVSPVTATVMHHHHQQPNWHFAWYYLYFRFFLTRATALELLALKWWQQAKNSY